MLEEFKYGRGRRRSSKYLFLDDIILYSVIEVMIPTTIGALRKTIVRYSQKKKKRFMVHHDKKTDVVYIARFK